MGSKAKYAKEILPIILKDRKPGQWYIEPFVGGANVIDKVDGLRFGSDINNDLIILLSAIRDNWVPPEIISEDEYNNLKAQKSSPLRSFAGFGCSFGGKWFCGYARDKTNRNYAAEAKRNLLAQAPNLKGVDFCHCSYDELMLPDNSLIYCDIPYFNTTSYKDKAFNHDKFWKWAEERANMGHQMFVSEYTSPSHWKCVWERQVNSSFDHNRKAGKVKQSVERLFTL